MTFSSQRPRSTVGYLLLGALLCFAALGVFTGSRGVGQADAGSSGAFSPLLSRSTIDFSQLLPKEEEVRLVRQADTDGDGQREWVVLYQFDSGDQRNPVAGAIYDYDRGDPPVLFPYRLLPPERNYLSEDQVDLQFKDMVSTGEDVQPVPEIFVLGTSGGLTTTLTIFRHVPNSLEWEYPRDEPRRYQPIGYFRGDGGVQMNEKTHLVTVTSRANDRSQLAVQTVYALDTRRDTYMSPTNPNELSAPISSKVTFAFGMPADILDSPYPEKIVLAFYQTLAGSNQAVPAAFLTGEALTTFNQVSQDPGKWSYFGINEVKAGDRLVDLKVTELRYSPEVETQGASVTILGEDPQTLVVSVKFDATVGGKVLRTEQPVVWVTTLVNGKWRIERHLN